MSFTFFWINDDKDYIERQHMYTIIASLQLHQLRIPALSLYGTHCIGNELRQRTLSHIRAIIRLYKMKQYNLTSVLIAEDTITTAYMPYWLHTLSWIEKNAPPDWGVIQLSYYMNYKLSFKDIFYSPYAPYIPWHIHKLRGTSCYLIHPRGRTQIINAVKNYKKKNKSMFLPHISAEHLFSIAVTYTFHYPLFDYNLQNNYENTYKIQQKKELTCDFIEYINHTRRLKNKN